MQLARYVLRPPIAQERPTRTADGRVLLTLKAEWTDGTTHLLLEPVEVLERLAALTPRPRINLVLHDGVLAPHSRWRGRCGGRMRVLATIEDPVVIRKILTTTGFQPTCRRPGPTPRPVRLELSPSASDRAFLARTLGVHPLTRVRRSPSRATRPHHRPGRARDRSEPPRAPLCVLRR
jgi:hypothetical protein